MAGFQDGFVDTLPLWLQEWLRGDTQTPTSPSNVTPMQNTYSPLRSLSDGGGGDWGGGDSFHGGLSPEVSPSEALGQVWSGAQSIFDSFTPSETTSTNDNSGSFLSQLGLSNPFTGVDGLFGNVGNPTASEQFFGNATTLGGAARLGLGAYRSLAEQDQPGMGLAAGLSALSIPAISSFIPGAGLFGLIGGGLNAMGAYQDPSEYSGTAYLSSDGVLSAPIDGPGGYSYQEGNLNNSNTLEAMDPDTQVNTFMGQMTAADALGMIYGDDLAGVGYDGTGFSQSALDDMAAAAEAESYSGYLGGVGDLPGQGINDPYSGYLGSVDAIPGYGGPMALSAGQKVGLFENAGGYNYGPGTFDTTGYTYGGTGGPVTSGSFTETATDAPMSGMIYGPDGRGVWGVENTDGPGDGPAADDYSGYGEGWGDGNADSDGDGVGDAGDGAGGGWGSGIW